MFLPYNIKLKPIKLTVKAPQTVTTPQPFTPTFITNPICSVLAVHATHLFIRLNLPPQINEEKKKILGPYLSSSHSVSSSCVYNREGSALDHVAMTNYSGPVSGGPIVLGLIFPGARNVPIRCLLSFGEGLLQSPNGRQGREDDGYLCVK